MGTLQECTARLLRWARISRCVTGTKKLAGTRISGLRTIQISVCSHVYVKKGDKVPLFYLTPLTGVFILPRKNNEFGIIRNDL
jgi:hypothetical protein